MFLGLVPYITVLLVGCEFLFLFVEFTLELSRILLRICCCALFIPLVFSHLPSLLSVHLIAFSWSVKEGGQSVEISVGKSSQQFLAGLSLGSYLRTQSCAVLPV